jgi:hypothetical protein
MSFNIVPAKNFKQARLESAKAEHLKAPQLWGKVLSLTRKC